MQDAYVGVYMRVMNAEITSTQVKIVCPDSESHAFRDGDNYCPVCGAKIARIETPIVTDEKPVDPYDLFPSQHVHYEQFFCPNGSYAQADYNGYCIWLPNRYVSKYGLFIDDSSPDADHEISPEMISAHLATFHSDMHTAILEMRAKGVQVTVHYGLVTYY